MEPWEIEAAVAVNKHGADPDKARLVVALRWMWHGDFRPLAAMIRTGEVLDDAVLGLLLQLIDDGRLTVSKRKGRPKNPEAQVRNLTAALLYENDQGSFAEVAAALGMGQKAVEKAVTDYRRRMRKK